MSLRAAVERLRDDTPHMTHFEDYLNPARDRTKFCVRCKLDAILAAHPAETAAYDKTFGDERLCACGHPYRRHFDTYDEMQPIGCKYCDCLVWAAPRAERPEETKR